MSQEQPDLGAALLEASGAQAGHHSVADPDVLGQAVGEVVARGRAAVPGVALSDTDFVRHLAGRIPEGPLEEGLAALNAEDTYLAWAAGRGDEAAVRLLDAKYGDVMRFAALRVLRTDERADEVLQELRVKLLVGTSDVEPKILGYLGRGPLRAWLQVAATRAALTFVRGERRREAPGPTELLDHALIAKEHPELERIWEQARSEFREAFRVAFDALEVRDRNVLRHHLLDGLTIDQIGKIYGAHRATAARWIARARERLLEATTRRLQERLRLSDSELESMVRLVRSQLDVSILDLIAGPP